MTKMYPIMWMFLISMAGVVAIPLTGAPGWLLAVMAACYASVLGVAIIAFVYAFIWRPDRLEEAGPGEQSEAKDSPRP